jgi:pentatricopeptide repeat protein
MDTRIAVFTIVSIIASVPLSAQSDFEYSLSSHKGNKIVLLGQWSGADLSKWKEVLDSDAIYGHGFQMLTRDRLIKNNSDTFVSQFAIKDGNIEAFERWIRQKYGLANSARWAALGMYNKLIVAGTQAPSTKEFDEMLMQKGVKTPQRMLRDFLRENPGHIDAMTDLLTEVRRRALHIMPPNPTEDLDTEKDLLTWAVMAAETDKVFSGDWLGIDIMFFRPDKVQPERYSKLMRNVFKKHIPKVEQAIALNPMNDTLWNIWAWMAQCNPDYKWNPFINSIEPGIYPYQSSFRAFPEPSVCTWLVEESKARKDWNTIIKLGRVATRFRGNILSGYQTRTEWTPNSVESFGRRETIKDYPARAYATYLEALLRVGRIDEANNLYDEMIRREGKIDRYSTTITVNGKPEKHKAENALIVASAARAAGMEDIAKIWEMGEQINKIPYAKLSYFEASASRIGITSLSRAKAIPTSFGLWSIGLSLG